MNTKWNCGWVFELGSISAGSSTFLHIYYVGTNWNCGAVMELLADGVMLENHRVSVSKAKTTLPGAGQWWNHLRNVA
ncbi:hypothetical protein GBAR_LOCUS2114 [Geodia barretti]|uniref:Uncharacterized protein n=1 Tax=Geodia barretti TaxID=519541 RepID=A0AA35QZF1_GEOBA|nr:hypothetical protein GBAR_LOCUS2114 [Geodia barretti]